jgi:hypothetical protein
VKLKKLKMKTRFHFISEQHNKRSLRIGYVAEAIYKTFTEAMMKELCP